MPGEQLSMDFGIKPAPDLIYFALRPDEDAARAIGEVAQWCRRRHRLSGRLYGPDRLHVSLHPVRSRKGLRKGDVDAALQAAAHVRGRPFPIRFDRIRTFNGGDTQSIVLCSGDGKGAVTALRERLRWELFWAGLRREPARFEPHLTLLRDRNSVPPIDLDEPIGWTVEDFVLVRSLVGRSRHVDIERWRLAQPR